MAFVSALQSIVPPSLGLTKQLLPSARGRLAAPKKGVRRIEIRANTTTGTEILPSNDTGKSTDTKGVGSCCIVEIILQEQ